jgi:deoxycytidylate deaminase
MSYNETLFDNFYKSFANEASKSTITHKLCAGILINKKLVTKPKCNVSRNLCRNMFCGSLHAEQRSLLDFYGKHLQYNRLKAKWFLNSAMKEKKVDLIVMRITADSKVANSRPCYNCLKMMNDLKIQKIYYTTELQNLICENVNEMFSIQISSVSRFLEDPFSLECKEQYYNSMMKLYFPKNIKEYNLNCFIEHSFKQIFKDYTIVYKKKNGVLTVYFYNEENIIVSSIVT